MLLLLIIIIIITITITSVLFSKIIYFCVVFFLLGQYDKKYVLFFVSI